jgi:hypothetical protein
MASRNDAMIRAFLLLTLVGAVFAGKRAKALAKEDGVKEASSDGKTDRGRGGWQGGHPGPDFGGPTL